ncbi:hypothetical protein PGIGA_G00054680 [Pangasianodon gigas]|uniref:Uncharacterized protein n=1 Tax=Pangasianodon gigas TaxID=30993 RepID=A0ACC5X387_PANGG|nr:hypothetical protein [Pangasianodon gigas]
MNALFLILSLSVIIVHRDTGSVQLPVTVPDTITTWETEAFCVSSIGLGLAPPVQLTVFQPFFLELSLPYSIIRGEVFELKATVFNYLSKCIMVKVTPASSSDYTLEPSSDGEYSSCLCANGRKTFKWTLIPTVLGVLKVTVSAEAEQSQTVCDNEIVSVPERGRIDTVTRSLIVQAEGTEKTKSQSWLLCPQGNSVSEELELILPEDVIEGSARASVSVLGKTEEIRGGVNDDVTITAYITASLLELGNTVQDPVVNKGLLCLKSSVGDLTNTYTTALLAYTFSLAGENEIREQLLNKLENVAISGDGRLHWSQSASDDSGALSVEISSYVLLAVLTAGQLSAADLGYANRIVSWLVKQQNPYGGFSSTQDTVVALQALALYSTKVFSSDGSSTVTVKSADGHSHNFDVNQNNKLLYQERSLQDVPGKYSIEVKGSTCVSVQTALFYNVPTPTEISTLSITAKTEGNCTKSFGQTLSLKFTVGYTGTLNNTNMIIVDIKLLSGFTADPGELKKGILVERVDSKDDHIIMYIKEAGSPHTEIILCSSPDCWRGAERTSPVQHASILDSRSAYGCEAEQVNAAHLEANKDRGANLPSWRRRRTTKGSSSHFSGEVVVENAGMKTAPSTMGTALQQLFQASLQQQTVSQELAHGLQVTTQELLELRKCPNPCREAQHLLTKLTAADDMDTFERFVQRESWPKKDWAPALAPFLTGGAQLAYHALTPDEAARTCCSDDMSMPMEPDPAAPHCVEKPWLARCVLQKATPPSLPTVPVKVNGQPVSALLDSGSTVTLAHPSILTSLKPNGSLMVSCVHGDIREVPAAQVTVNHQAKEWPLLVGLIPKLPMPLLLGQD